MSLGHLVGNLTDATMVVRSTERHVLAFGDLALPKFDGVCLDSLPVEQWPRLENSPSPTSERGLQDVHTTCTRSVESTRERSTWALNLPVSASTCFLIDVLSHYLAYY